MPNTNQFEHLPREDDDDSYTEGEDYVCPAASSSSAKKQSGYPNKKKQITDASIWDEDEEDWIDPGDDYLPAFYHNNKEVRALGRGGGGGKKKKKQADVEKGEANTKNRKLESRLQADKQQLDVFEDAGGMHSQKARSIIGFPTAVKPVGDSNYVWEVEKGFMPNMRVPARFYADAELALMLAQEMTKKDNGGFLSAVEQLGNVATLPGILGYSFGMPDLHSGYGFAVGSVAAVDLDNPDAVVSPGGVGFDINCGVRVLATPLFEKDIRAKKAELATAIYKAVPCGVGGASTCKIGNESVLKKVCKEGMNWCLKEGMCYEEDLDVCEERGQLPADPSYISIRALKRGLPQLGTLGSGNHYLEVQVVDEVYDMDAARAMGFEEGQVCVMIHCGSRGLGHQVCTDHLQNMQDAMKRQNIVVPDKQLASVKVSSEEGQAYLNAMGGAANYAFCNRTIIMQQVRDVFNKMFDTTPRDIKMVYDVCHNIAKFEDHIVNEETKRTLVHRKGATRAYPPHHPSLPEKYKECGQPVLIGGSMGTSSYVLAGTDTAARTTFASTCHGAGRKLSRTAAKQVIDGATVISQLQKQGIEVRVASPKLISEEADAAYKDASRVIDVCHGSQISKKVVRLRPMIVVKG